MGHLQYTTKAPLVPNFGSGDGLMEHRIWPRSQPHLIPWGCTDTRAHPGAQDDLSSWHTRKPSRLHPQHARASPRAKAPGAQVQPPSGAVALPAMRRENGLIGRTSDRPARRAGGASPAARSTTGRRKGVSCVACMGRNASSQAQLQNPRHLCVQLPAAGGPSRRSPGLTQRGKGSFGPCQNLRQPLCPHRCLRQRLLHCIWRRSGTMMAPHRVQQP